MALAGIKSATGERETAKLRDLACELSTCKSSIQRAVRSIPAGVASQVCTGSERESTQTSAAE